MKILITDDNLDAAESLAMLLRISGHSVVLAGDGVEALHTMTSWVPDLVILDLMMPDRNGWEFLDAKAKMASYDKIPVIVLSGYTRTTEPLEGVSAVFEKAAPPGEILDAVAAIFQGKEKARVGDT
jgi:CheY-like chemotaxis protein